MCMCFELTFHSIISHFSIIMRDFYVQINFQCDSMQIQSEVFLCYRNRINWFVHCVLPVHVAKGIEKKYIKPKQQQELKIYFIFKGLV